MENNDDFKMARQIIVFLGALATCAWAIYFIIAWIS